MKNTANQAVADAAWSIGLTNVETAAVTWFLKRHFRGTDANLAHAIKLLLRVALEHPETVSDWINGVASYRDAEGFESSDPVHQSLIKGRPEYRRLFKVV